MDTRFKELKEDIQATDSELKGKIEATDADLKGKIGNIEATDVDLKGKINSTYAELEKKIGAGDKKLEVKLKLMLKDYDKIIEGKSMARRVRIEFSA